MDPTLPTFFLVFLLFPTFSRKFPTRYPYFFTLKCHLRDKNTAKFSSVALLAPILEISFFGEQTAKNLDFEILTQKL